MTAERGDIVARTRVDTILGRLRVARDVRADRRAHGRELHDRRRGAQALVPGLVTNRGQLLTLEGRFEDGRVLAGVQIAANGRESRAVRSKICPSATYW
jgi:hypothetical protein